MMLRSTARRVHWLGYSCAGIVAVNLVTVRASQSNAGPEFILGTTLPNVA
jgi:hypothetical protein